MDDDELDEYLRRLGEQEGTAGAGPDFQAGVWQRVGRMAQARDQRRRTMLGLAILVVALGTGVGVTQGPTDARPSRLAFADVSDLSPATLLHVSP